MIEERTMDTSGEIRIISGTELPAQFHLGRACSSDWIDAADQELAKAGWLSVKPTGVLWSAPATRRNRSGHIETSWSETYYRRGYDVDRERKTPWGRRMRQKLTPERQWQVLPDPDARVVRLGTLADLQAAAARWPTPQGHISFQAMAADGIDGVWVEKSVIADAWGQEERESEGANLRAAFYGWEIESVVWLRADRLNIGEPVRVLREEQSATSTANELLAEITALCEQPEPQRWEFSDVGSPEQAVTDTQHQI